MNLRELREWVKMLTPYEEGTSLKSWAGVWRIYYDEDRTPKCPGLTP